MKCEHRPERLYAWVVPKVHNRPDLGSVLCVACCDCGETWERDHKAARPVRAA